MAGPDPKRMFLAINSQNIQSLKAEKPYWSKPFVFVTPSGSGPKYTALQASMLLQKMKVVDFLIDQPSLDVAVKSTDGKNTLIVAVEAKMDVSVLEKLLQRLELKCLTEVDGSGKGALDYAEPDTEVYEFLHSMGCKTRQEREAAIVGFLGETVKGTVPGVSEHQRRRREGGRSKRKPDKKSQASSASVSSAEVGTKSDPHDGEHTEESPPEEEEEEAAEENAEETWRKFDNTDDLEAALHAYINEWGDDHEEGQSCQEWLRKIGKAKQTGKTDKVLKKWNATIDAMQADDQTPQKEEGSAKSKAADRGRTKNRSSSNDNVEAAATIDPEFVKMFFAAKADEQVNSKHKSKHSHRLTFVVSPRSASAGASDEHSEDAKKMREASSSRRASSGGSSHARRETATTNEDA